MISIAGGSFTVPHSLLFGVLFATSGSDRYNLLHFLASNLQKPSKCRFLSGTIEAKSDHWLPT